MHSETQTSLKAIDAVFTEIQHTTAMWCDLSPLWVHPGTAHRSIWCALFPLGGGL